MHIQLLVGPRAVYEFVSREKANATTREEG